MKSSFRKVKGNNVKHLKWKHNILLPFKQYQLFYCSKFYFKSDTYLFY